MFNVNIFHLLSISDPLLSILKDSYDKPVLRHEVIFVADNRDIQ